MGEFSCASPLLSHISSFNSVYFGRFNDLAERVRRDSIELTNRSGLLEYFNPVTGEGAGGHDFSWTASMCLSWLDRPAAIAIGNKMGGTRRKARGEDTSN